MSDYIYGVSSKYLFDWSHKVYCFINKQDARAWLNKDEGDFRERELMSERRAIKLAGKDAVKQAQLIIY